VDTASVDYGQTKDFKSHQILAAQNIWNLENLNNVNKLPPNGFTLYNMAYKSKEGSGGPSRVIAIIEPISSSSSKASTKLSAVMILPLIFSYLLN
jgi:kynurenine formamidase